MSIFKDILNNCICVACWCIC